MKKQLMLLGLYFMGTGVAGAREYPKVDYMKLTRQSIPHMQVLVQGALDNMGIGMNSTAMTKTIRRGALLPDFTVRAAYHPDGLAEYERLNYESSRRSDSNNPNNPANIQTIDEYKQTGFTSRSDWAVTLEWNLTHLIHSQKERSLSARRVQMASLQRRRIVDVAKRYALLMGAFPADKNEAADPAKMASILENAVILDVWTGGMLTRVLERTSMAEH